MARYKWPPPRLRQEAFQTICVRLGEAWACCAFPRARASTPRSFAGPFGRVWSAELRVSIRQFQFPRSPFPRSDGAVPNHDGPRGPARRSRDVPDRAGYRTMSYVARSPLANVPTCPQVPRPTNGVPLGETTSVSATFTPAYDVRFRPENIKTLLKGRRPRNDFRPKFWEHDSWRVARPRCAAALTPGAARPKKQPVVASRSFRITHPIHRRTILFTATPGLSHPHRRPNAEAESDELLRAILLPSTRKNGRIFSTRHKMGPKADVLRWTQPSHLATTRSPTTSQ